MNIKILFFALVAMLFVTCTTEVIEDYCPTHNANDCYGENSSSSLGGYSYGGASSSSRVSSSSSIATCPTFNVETHFCDSRDFKVYKKTTINGMIWMAENLQYNATGSICYQNNCATYGRYYTWQTAMGLASSCTAATCASQIGEKHQGVCPQGWHIFNESDWDALGDAGGSLRASSGWQNVSAGTDSYGFTALPGGFANSDNSFHDVGYGANWWLADNAIIRRGQLYLNDYERSASYTTSLYNVRCVNNSSVYIPPSSSSVTPSSSSSVTRNVVNGDPVTYGGETYQTVIIGEQTWMARNLNYNVSDSKCYNNSTANCTKYGRLYSFDMAETACPSGWHLPSRTEWSTLSSYVQSAQGCSGCAAKHLKSTSGWNSSGNGTDTYGFAALPGGYYWPSESTSYYVGDRGLWWTSEWTQGTQTANAAFIYMVYDGEAVTESAGAQSGLRSVRCIKGNSTPSSSSVTPSSSSVVPSSSSVTPSSSSVVPSSSSIERNVVNGDPVEYMGETYQTVVIGTQTWFARNLNYNVSGSVCYNNQDSYCEDYGRLYNWATAMALSSSCNSSTCSGQISTKHQGICPTGWHIPTNADWDKLYRYADGTSGTSSPYTSATAGRYLKATSGWNSYSVVVPAGQDTYGFAALPGGYGDSGGSLTDVGYNGYWWSAMEHNAYNASYRNMRYHDENAIGGNYYKTHLFSVRCLKD